MLARPKAQRKATNSCVMHHSKIGRLRSEVGSISRNRLVSVRGPVRSGKAAQRRDGP